MADDEYQPLTDEACLRLLQAIHDLPPPTRLRRLWWRLTDWWWT